MDTSDTVLALEADLRLLCRDLTTPLEGECLACYVARMLDEFGCTGLRWALRYRDLTAPRATALERRLGSMGAYCDCELFLNGYTPVASLCGTDEYGDLAEPQTPSTCAGVRRGSTRPCSLWVRQLRGGW